MNSVRSHFFAVLAVLLSAFSHSAWADRYLTWVDEEGEIRHTRVSDPETDTKPSDTSEAGSKGEESPVTQSSEKLPAIVLEVKASPEPADREAGELEPSRKEEPSGPGFDTSDFIDAAQLERQGFVRDGRQRFYTWIDAEGNVRSEPVGQQQSAEPEPELKLRFSGVKAVVANEQYLNAASRKNAAPGKAEAEALSLLGLDQNGHPREIERLAEFCCKALEDAEPQGFRWGDDLLVYLEADEDIHNFGLGISPYRLISLPEEMPEETLFVLRTFVGKDMLSPALVTLDEQFQPVRLLTDIVYAYTPGTWRTHAYMEGFFTVKAEDTERYLVIFSRGLDQRRKTVVDGLSEKPLVIPHSRTGGLYLSFSGEDDS